MGAKQQMKYVIMCAGNGKRWGNYLGIPKHFVEINGETLIGRTTRLLKEHGITDYIITTSDERYKQYGETREQTNNDCEIDRYEEIEDDEICYLYGDVYYTEEAMDTIINTPTDEILFFGSDMEIFAVKIKDKDLFMKHKHKVKELYLKGKIERCIGWEVYKSINNLPLDEYAITDRFVFIQDGTDDIDTPKNYLNFKFSIEGENQMIKLEAIKEFTFGDFDKIRETLTRGSVKAEPGRIYAGDTFECDKATAEYLLGDNAKKAEVVKIVEVIPETLEKYTSGYCEIIEEPQKEEKKPVKKSKKKK